MVKDEIYKQIAEYGNCYAWYMGGPVEIIKKDDALWARCLANGRWGILYFAGLDRDYRVENVKILQREVIEILYGRLQAP